MKPCRDVEVPKSWNRRMVNTNGMPRQSSPKYVMASFGTPSWAHQCAYSFQHCQ